MATKKETIYEVIAEIPIGNSVWKAQRVVYSDGSSGYGLRKFVTRADGAEQVTGNGLYVLDDSSAKEHVAAVVKLMATVAVSLTPTQAIKKYRLVHALTRESYGAVNWKGVPIKGLPKDFGSIQDAKNFRAEKCPEQYAGAFKARRVHVP